jgi:hypothetical protein
MVYLRTSLVNTAVWYELVLTKAALSVFTVVTPRVG